MNQNQNIFSTITNEQILQIANVLRNGLGIQQTQANLDKGQGWSRTEIVGRHPSQRHKEDKSHLHCTHCGIRNTLRRLASKSWVIPNGGKIPNQKIARLTLP